MKIKKTLRAAVLAPLMAVPLPALAAGNSGLCELIAQMQSVFQTLRVLAFVGAAFILASWAWDFIKGGDGGKGDKTMETLKAKGISMLVGFVLLFAVGIGISFLLNGNLVDCADILKKGW
jgi:hypothetical protein